jgi:hypothetical protein
MKGIHVRGCFLALRCACAAALCLMLPAAPAATLDGGAFPFRRRCQDDAGKSGAARAALASHRSDDTRAAAKLAEVKDDTPAADRTRIEGEHRAIAAELVTVNREIATIERAHAGAGSDRSGRGRAHAHDEITRLALRHGMPAEFATGILRTARRSTRCGRGARSRRGRGDRTRISPRVQVGNDEGDTIRRAVERCDHAARQSERAAGQRAGTRNGARLSRHVADRVRPHLPRGDARHPLRGLNRRELATVLLGLDQLGTRAAGMMSTSDFRTSSRTSHPSGCATLTRSRRRIGKRFRGSRMRPISRNRAVVQLSNLPSFKKVARAANITYAASPTASESTRSRPMAGSSRSRGKR